jgi:glycosyltransferase involved in cell wall biosynthesis
MRQRRSPNGKMAMSDQALVSVILCNYNYRRFVGEAIESVLRQSYENLELIIVDDGSTDGSRSVIQSFLDKRIGTVFHQSNLGQAAALNTGFARSKGSFLAFLDADDAWMPHKLAAVLGAFEDASLSLVQHNLQVIDSDFNLIDRIHPGIQPGVRDVLQAYFKENHTGFFSVTSGITSTRTVLQHVFPLPESWRICADVPLTRPLPIFGLVTTLEEPLGYYRIHGANTWMDSPRQASWIENEERYTAYTNECLARFGYTDRVHFIESGVFRSWRLHNLPPYHPERLLTQLRMFVAAALPQPLKAPLRAVLRHTLRRVRPQ